MNAVLLRLVGAFLAFAFCFISGGAIGYRWAHEAHLKEEAARAWAAVEAEFKAREDERRTSLRVMELTDDAHRQARDARRSAAAAAGERDRLRDAYLAASFCPAEAPAVASSSPATAGSGLVRARLFDGAADLLQSCAAALDQARIAGITCERAYDTLTSADSAPAEVSLSTRDHRSTP